MKNNGRNHCGFIYTEKGCEHYNFSSGRIDAEPGSLIFIPKGEVYTIDLDDEESIAFCFDFELSDETHLSPLSVCKGAASRLRSLFIDSERIWKRKKVGYKADCMSILYKIIARAQRQAFEGIHPKNFAKIKTAVDYLGEHYADRDFKISKLYELSELSPKYFGTLFKAQFGVGPKEYAVSLRIERAKELLQSERLSVTTVSEMVGFSDVYHFSKVFKENTLYSPSEYKRITQN